MQRFGTVRSVRCPRSQFLVLSKLRKIIISVNVQALCHKIQANMITILVFLLPLAARPRVPCLQGSGGLGASSSECHCVAVHPFLAGLTLAANDVIDTLPSATGCGCHCLLRGHLQGCKTNSTSGLPVTVILTYPWCPDAKMD